MQHKRVSVGELLRDYVSAAENVTEWGRSKKADIARLQASGPADVQAFKLTVQFGRVNLQRKSPWRARTPGGLRRRLDLARTSLLGVSAARRLTFGLFDQELPAVLAVDPVRRLAAADPGSTRLGGRGIWAWPRSSRWQGTRSARSTGIHEPGREPLPPNRLFLFSSFPRCVHPARPSKRVASLTQKSSIARGWLL